MQLQVHTTLSGMHLEGPLYAPAPNMLQAGCPQHHMLCAISTSNSHPVPLANPRHMLLVITG